MDNKKINQEPLNTKEVILDVKNLNTTFRALLNDYRIGKAKYLLDSGTDSIANIAYECGYDSLVSFNRNFKKLTGLTPSQYRIEFP